MSDTPSIRAFMAQSILQAARTLQEAQQQRIFERVSPEVVSLITLSPKAAWVPLAQSSKLTDAVHEELGSQKFRQLFTEVARDALKYPLLRKFFDAAIRLLGLSPSSLLKWSVHAWEYSFQGCGKLVFRLIREDDSGGEVEMVLEGLPPEFMRSGTFVESLAGTFESFLTQASREGRVDIPSRFPKAGHVVYRVSWKQAAGAG
jgi:hypothetical protein